MNDTSWDELEARVANCRLCPRLVAWREETARVKRRMYRDEEYWGRPVPGWGDRNARLLIVGLAPAAHGGNRTGRVFTGDSSGDFLYAALHRAGFANQPESRHVGDGLALRDAYIAAAARCAPPDNKPTPEELATCRPYLAQEIALLDRLEVIVALGRIGPSCRSSPTPRSFGWAPPARETACPRWSRPTIRRGRTPRPAASPQPCSTRCGRRRPRS